MAIKLSYLSLLKHLGKTVPVKMLWEDQQQSDIIALRHDVDHDLDMALEMAYWEQVHGFASTYYLLHTADYWSDPQLVEKALQIQDFGHEIGLHVNLLSQWMRGEITDLAATLQKVLQPLRAAGVQINGLSSHGDKLCYQEGFINFWCFKELRPTDPLSSMAGLTAEGIPAGKSRQPIAYPPNHCLKRTDGKTLPLWSMSLTKHGFDYEALHVPHDHYYSDSGGAWYEGKNPQQLPIHHGRHQVLVHPEHWQAPQKTYFFLSTARSGSLWLSTLLDAATSVKACHEFSLNHRYRNGILSQEKRTGNGFVELCDNPAEIRQLLAESRDWQEAQSKDCAEANIYLEECLPVLEEVFPDAVLVHVHRDPKEVVRSIINRHWYDTPDDDRHPRFLVEGWEFLSQFEKACWYVRHVYERLARACGHAICFEQMTHDFQYLSSRLKELGIAVYPRLAHEAFSHVINANRVADFPVYQQWPEEDKCTFHSIVWPVIMALGYEGGYAKNYDAELGSLLRRAELHKREQRVKKRGHPKISREVVASLDFAGCDPGEFFVQGCRVESTPEGVLLEPLSPDRHGHCIIGGGTWYSLGNTTEGWPHRIGTYLRGTIRLRIEGEGLFQFFCLMFDNEGRQVGKRALLQSRSGEKELKFSCRLLNQADRFNFAVYLRKDDLPRQVVLKKLYVERLNG